MYSYRHTSICCYMHMYVLTCAFLWTTGNTKEHEKGCAIMPVLILTDLATWTASTCTPADGIPDWPGSHTHTDNLCVSIRVWITMTSETTPLESRCWLNVLSFPDFTVRSWICSIFSHLFLQKARERNCFFFWLLAWLLATSHCWRVWVNRE